MPFNDDPGDGPDELEEHQVGWHGRVGRDSQPEEGSDNEEGIGAGPGVGAGLLAVSALILALRVGHDSPSAGDEEKGGSEETHTGDSRVELDGAVVVVDGVPFLNPHSVPFGNCTVEVFVDWDLVDVNHFVELLIVRLLGCSHYSNPGVSVDHVMWSGVSGLLN